MEGRMMTSQCAQLSVGKLFIRSVAKCAINGME